MQQYNISIDPNPLSITSYKLDSGQLVLGNGNQVSLDNNRDLDRQVQQ